MKTTARLCAAALLSNLAISSALAGGFYAGGEVGVATVPNFTDAATQTVVNSGIFTTVSVSQNKASGQGGIYGGQWVTENVGWEVSLVSLGTIRGRIAAANASTVTFMSYQYSTGAMSVAALGGVDISSAGKLFIKAGVYDAGVTFDGPTNTVSRNSAGPVLGGGYSHQFMTHLSGKVEVADYFGVRFPDFEFFSSTNNTTKHNIVTLSVGAAYVF
jgi:hypothetical protein